MASNGTIYVSPMPKVMFGLENATDEQLSGVIKAHAWPIQDEEWHLQYWLNKGFQVFLVANLESSLTSSTPAIKRLHTEITETCAEVKHFDPVKPIFLEFSATIFECTL